jgi:hypothetical protein
MPTTRYLLAGEYSNIVLQCDSAEVLVVTKAFVENVANANPARAELLGQLARIAQSLNDAIDCEIREQKHGYLRDVVLNLFDSGKATIISGNRSYSSSTLKKERWSDEKLPGHPRGGSGGFLYRSSDGQVMLKQRTWVS